MIEKYKFLMQTPYMGYRNFSTEDLQEQFDTKFQEVIWVVSPNSETLPIGITIMAVLAQ